jgi:hypothetical protein
MANLWYELRLIVCYWLLDLVLSLSPKERDGLELIKAIHNHLARIVAKERGDSSYLEF